MKLYKTLYTDDLDENPAIRKVHWDGTQTDASKLRKSLKTEGMREIVTVPTDVPTDKAGLLTFLNAGQ